LEKQLDEKKKHRTPLQNVHWTPERVNILGANVAVIGAYGSGKTELEEAFAELVYFDQTLRKRPQFKIYVHAIKEVFKKNWHNGLCGGETPIHRKRVTFRSKRFNYLKSDYHNSLVFLEDLPAWIEGKDREQADTITLNNFLSTVRHRNTVFFASAQSLIDFFTILGPQVLSKFSHYVLFHSAESMLRLSKVGMSIGSCHTINGIVRNLPKFNCVTIDLRQRLMTRPFENIEPDSLVNMTLNKNNQDDVLPIEISERPEKISDPNKIIPLSQTSNIIVERLKKDSNINLSEFAKELGMAEQTMYNWIQRLKKQNYLEKDKRYGAARR